MFMPQGQQPQMSPVGAGNTNPAIGGSVYQQRLAQIKAMPPGPQQDAALAALARDYQGENDLASKQMDYAQEAIGAGTPEATQTGGRFGTTVAANPLQHLASGLRTYKGYKDMSEAQDTMKTGSKAKQEALMAMLRAGL